MSRWRPICAGVGVGPPHVSLLLWLLLGLWAPVASAQNSESRWVPLDGESLCRRPRAEALETCAIEDGEVREAVEVQLLLPLRPGVALRVEGAEPMDAALGFGASPDALSLVQRSPATRHEFYVPTFGGGDFAVVRIPPGVGHRITQVVSPGTHVATRAAEQVVLDALQHQDLGADEAPSGSVVVSRAEARMSELRALLPGASSDLWAQWLSDEIDRLERSFEPLRTPWFMGVGRHRAQVLGEGESRFVEVNADVWSVGVRGETGRMNVIEVWLGDRLHHVERMDLRVRPRQAVPRFGVQRRVRVPVIRGDAEAPALIVRVRSGSAQVRAVAYRERPSAFGPHASPSPKVPDVLADDDALLSGAIALGRASTSAAARARFIKAALGAVEGPFGSDGRRAFAYYLAARFSPEDGALFAHVQSAAERPAFGPSLWAALLAQMQRRQVLAPSLLCERREHIIADQGTGMALPGDRTVVRAALTQMCDDRARALDAVGLLETAIRRHPDDLFLRSAARKARRTHLRWETLQALGTAQEPWVRPVVGEGGEGASCHAKGFAGVRWSVLSTGHHVVRVEDEDVRVRTLSSDETWEGQIGILGAPVSVHGALGLESRVRVPVGQVSIDVPRGAPKLLVRLARGDEVPCDALRDVAFPLQAGQATTFALQPADSWLGFAKLDVLPVAASQWQADPQGWGAQTRTLRFRVVTEDGSLLVTLPADRRTSLTLPVPRGARLVTVLPAPASVGQALVQLRVPRARDISASLRRERLERAETAEAQQAALDELRAASATLASAPGDLDGRARADLHLRRARALFALGYSSLSASERALAGDTALRFGTTQTRLAYENMAAELPPLPVRDPSRLRLIRELVGRGALAHARSILNTAPSASAESALLALVSEREGDLRGAATAWLATETAVGQAQAAGLYAQLAERGGDTGEVVLAYAHASAAAKQEVANNPAYDRLHSAVQWDRPAAAEDAAGTELVVTPRAPSDALMYEVRRAFMDAPQDAYVLDEGQRMQFTLVAGSETRLSLEGACVALVAQTSCRLWLEVNDGPPRALEASDVLVLAKGRHHIVVRGEGRAYSWVRVRGEDDARMLEPEIARLWFAAERATPMRFAAMTPTVGRFAMSAQGRAPVDVDVLRDGETVATVTVPAAEMMDVSVPLLGEGPARIEVRPRSGRVLVRPTVVTHAEPLTVAPTPSLVAAVTPRPLAREVGTGAEAFQEDVDLGPVALRLSTRAVWGQTADFDARAEGTPFLELAFDADHRDLDGRFSVNGQAFARGRVGAPTFGLGGAAQLEGEGLRPRISVSTSIAAQQHDRLYLGNQNRASLVWGVPVHRLLSLHPVVAAGARYAPALPTDAEYVDADVSSDFARTHPYSGTLGLVLYSRPVLEIFARGGVYATSNADFATLDRVSARTSLTGVWGGTYLPFAELEYEVSQRFADQDRTRAFLRQVATLRMDGFATWFDSERLSVGAEVQWVFDRSEFLGFVSLEYLWSAGRGLYDQDTRRAPYPELLEEPGLTSLRVRGNNDELEADTSFDRSVSP